MDSLFTTATGLAISIVTVVAVYKMAVAYIYGRAVMKEIKELVLVLLLLGALPTLSSSAPKLGGYLVKPVVSLAENISHSVTADLKDAK